jgi:hypothetical protein
MIRAPRPQNRSGVALLGLAAATALLALPQLATSADPPRTVLRFEKAMIVDATGFEAPMAATTLFLPAGWKSQGGVLWGSQFACTNGYNFDWKAQSPDGSETIMVLPQTRWETNNYGAGPSTPGCQAAPFTTSRQYLDAFVQRWHPGARPLDFRQRNDLMQQAASYNKNTPMPLGFAKTWVDAGELLFAFNEGGRDMRGSATATVVFSLTRTQTAGMPQMDTLTGFAFPGYGVTAPNGKLNLTFFEAIRKTMQPNPQWSQRIANHNGAIAQVALEEGRKRAAIIANTNAEIAKIREDAWNASQESADRRAREFGELIRGVETYSDANAPGGTVQLSNLYNNAWRLNDGSYVLTNDASFQPYRDLGVDGQKLEQTK